MNRPAAAAGVAALVAVPVVAGAAAAVGTRLSLPTHEFYLRSPLWLTLLVTGAVAAAGLAALVLTGARAASRARRRAVAQARQAAAADHRRFLLRLDHELKNPVTAMQAGLANLTAQLTTFPTARAEAVTALDSVASQTRRLAGLVGDLRKLAELETRSIERYPVDLAELLAEVLELTEAGGRSVSLSLPQAPWPLAKVAGDRDLLFLTLYNLLGNAVKFTRPDDRIEVRARDGGDQVVVEVADTGIGIPADELGQVWEELARGRAARGTPGMGLGLAMVRAVVTRHGGMVAVRSREGHGTVVTLRLPVAAPVAG